MSLLLKHLFKKPWQLLLNMLCCSGFALAEFSIPTLLANMIDRQSMDQIGLMLILCATGVVLTLILGLFISLISNRMAYDIRHELYAHVQSLSLHQVDQFSRASLITRTNNDVYQIQQFIAVLLRGGVIAPLMFVVALVMILSVSRQLAWVVIATAPLILLVGYVLAKITNPLSENQQKSLDRMNGLLKDALVGLRVIRAFNQEERQRTQFKAENEYYRHQSTRFNLIMGLIDPSFFFLMNLAILAVDWLAVGPLLQGQLTMGELIAFSEYLFHFMIALLIACYIFTMFPRALVSARRIQEVLDCQSDQQEGSLVCEPIEDIEFEHVDLVYPDASHASLKNINLYFKAGQKVAIVGATGSGKSTLAKLLVRWMDTTKGEIRINGHVIDQYTKESLRRQITYVAQKPFLFEASLEDNVRFGQNTADIQQASQLASAYFIEKKGWQAAVSERGGNLSGGQKQRVALARGLSRSSSLYLFDDAFSALDLKTEARVQKNLKQYLKGRLWIVVAQRIAFIRDADHIVVMDEGQVVGQGRHSELLKTCPLYANLAQSQGVES